MNTHVDKTTENKSQSVSQDQSQIQSGGESTFQLVDNRPEAVALQKMQAMANNSPQVAQLRAFKDMVNNSFSKQSPPIQKKENNTGLPDNLKAGMENLSGISLDDVKVHRNSDKPAQLQAHAYAQGSDIHLAPGQERHLPHEAWHVVQQKQGRVKPTKQMKGKVNINDDIGLEKEADIMGEKALQMKIQHADETINSTNSLSSRVVQRMVQVGKKNIKRTVLVAAIKKGILQGLIPGIYLQRVDGNRVLNDASEAAINKLMEVYSSMTIHLKDFDSLIFQASQDLHMIANGNDNLIGIGHQHSEFTYKINRNDNNKKEVNFKTGLAKDNQRVYRTMTLKDWNNNHISGHGGSIGQAMHYFNLGKTAQVQAAAQQKERKPDLLVEFTFIGKKLPDLVNGIEGGGEGKHSTENTLGGKTEQNTAFGFSDKIFSVDLKNAAGLLSKNFVTAKVLASTNGELPKTVYKGKDIVWRKRPGN